MIELSKCMAVCYTVKNETSKTSIFEVSNFSHLKNADF